ncbi:MAG: ribosome silencing factor [Saprospiraceae bacterium]|nr:ribosome silencing factor [Saprospiraceae bacterium]
MDITTTNKSLKKFTAAQQNDLIIDAIQDIKGKNILKLDLRKLTDSPTDFFIICEGDSTTQVRAIAQNIQKRMRDEINIKPYHIEGFQGSRWVLVDFFTTVVHIFHPETRDFYNLERLWNDAEITKYENI